MASTAALEYQLYVFMSVSVSVCPCVTLAIAITKLWTTWTTWPTRTTYLLVHLDFGAMGDFRCSTLGDDCKKKKEGKEHFDVCCCKKDLWV